MANDNLSKIFGGPWSPPDERQPAPPEQQIIDAMRAAGLEPPEQIFMDGKIRRFRSGTKGGGAGNKGGDKPGWYVFFGDGIPAGHFGCWRMGVEMPWRADVGRRLTAAEEINHVRRMSEAKAIRDAELQRQHEVASDTVEMIWASAQAAKPEHSYLQRKGIGVHGARVTGDGRLVVPLYGQDGALSSLQYIAHDGGKLYHPGAQTGGKFWMLGTMDEPGPLFVAEGFATAATIHEVTHRPVVVAYSASNLVPVTGALREMYGAVQEIVVVADNDSSGMGQRYAEQAAAKHGARMVMPPVAGDANDYARSGHDLGILLMPPSDEWLIPADDFSAQPAPISWLVKRWVQDQALIMVHGPSGGGKTFVVLDWCLRMASGMSDWCGNKVKQGNVVYLAGEGHHGLRGRIAAWKHHHQAGHLAMWLSKDGCDLNTPEGYAKVVQQIRALKTKPNAIVIDTLHRFLSGDENSAQDAKTMLDACAALMREFNCSVILVHHTGVSDEVQHRARGSSAWRGALDIEISVIPGKDGHPMQIVQRKSKDAELAETVYMELQTVTIPGWLDEDGQPVTSAVVTKSSAEPAPKKDSKIDTHRKVFEAAWWESGAEIRNEMPYVSRSALKERLGSDKKRTARTIENDLSTAYPDKLIGALVLGQVVAPHEHGWVLTDKVRASGLIVAKNGTKNQAP